METTIYSGMAREPMTKQYNLKNIRALLTEGFSAEELRCFCYDEAGFRPVYNKFTQDTGKATIINWLLEDADPKLPIEVLLTWAREHNPAAYEKYQPYDDITISPFTSSGVYRKSRRAYLRMSDLPPEHDEFDSFRVMEEAVRTRAWKVILLVIVVLSIGVISLLPILRLINTFTPTDTPTPTITPTPTTTQPAETSTHTPTSTPTLIPAPDASTLTPTGITSPPPTGTPPPPILEITENTELSVDDTLGEVSIEYPIRMSPSSSDSVNVSIYIPDSLVSLIPIEVSRIPIPSDAPPIIGGLNSFQTTILITSTMRVELTSTTFLIATRRPTIQPVNVHDISDPTFWIWEIKAPDTAGYYVLIVQVYRGEDVNPSWIGGLQIEVTEFTPTLTNTPIPTDTPVPTNTPTNTPTLTPTPTPTKTPIPTPTLTPTPTPPALARIRDQLISNSSAILIALIPFIGALVVFGYQIYKKKRNRRQSTRAKKTTPPKKSTTPKSGE